MMVMAATLGEDPQGHSSPPPPQGTGQEALPAPAIQSHGMAPESLPTAQLEVPLGLEHAPLLTGWTLVQPVPAVPSASVF